MHYIDGHKMIEEFKSRGFEGSGKHLNPTPTDIATKGNVLVNRLEVGDIIAEYAYGTAIVTRVQTKPHRGEFDDQWTWQGVTQDGEIIEYTVTEGFEYYSANLYDYPAYIGPGLKYV